MNSIRHRLLALMTLLAVVVSGVSMPLAASTAAADPGDTASVGITLLLPSGDPAQLVSVQVCRDGGQCYDGSTDEFGTVTVAGLPAGTYSIVAPNPSSPLPSEDLLRIWSTGHVVTGGQSLTVDPLTFEQGATITGTITDLPSQEPLMGYLQVCAESTSECAYPGTDANGFFSVTGLEGGTYYVITTDPAYGATNSTTVTVARGESADAGMREVLPATTFPSATINLVGGTPPLDTWDEANNTFFPLLENGVPYVAPNGARIPATQVRVESAFGTFMGVPVSDGVYSFDRLPTGDLTITVLTQRNDIYDRYQISRSGSDSSIDIGLLNVPAITGTVTNAVGEPVVGATVSSCADVVGADCIGTASPANKTAETQTDGTFAFSNKPSPGKLIFKVTPPEGSGLPIVLRRGVDYGTDPVVLDFQLPAAYPVATAGVKDADGNLVTTNSNYLDGYGALAPGFSVRACLTDRQNSDPEGRWTCYAGTVAPNGSYQLNLPSGLYDVTFEKVYKTDGKVTGVQRATVPLKVRPYSPGRPADRYTSLTLPTVQLAKAGGTVTVPLMGPFGALANGVKYVELTLCKQGAEPFIGTACEIGRTTFGQQYSPIGLTGSISATATMSQDGAYDLMVRAENSAGSSWTAWGASAINLAGGVPVTADAVTVGSAVGSASGYMSGGYDAVGLSNPRIPGGFIENLLLCKKPSGLCAAPASGSWGDFQFANLPDGDYTLRQRGPNYFSYVRDVTVAGASPLALGTLPPTGILFGKVVGPDGAPVPFARVSDGTACRNVSFFTCNVGYTNDFGSFSIEGVAGTTYALEVIPPAGSGLVQGSMTVKAVSAFIVPGPAPTLLTLQGGGRSITGYVVDS
ncbi:MAG: collagen binding domain-containing protein, partial [Planctomycetia bacterium]